MLKYCICFSFALSLVFFSVCFSEEPESNDGDEIKQKVIFVDVTSLFKSIFPDSVMERPCSAGAHGTNCSFFINENERIGVDVRVCKDEKEAELTSENSMIILQVMPVRDDDSIKFGDKSYSLRNHSWKGYSENGYIQFRLKNVAITIHGNGKRKEAEMIAANIEDSILQGTNGVFIGEEILAPEIDVAIPEKMKPREKVVSDIIFKNIDPDKVIVSSPSTSVIVRSKGNIPTIEYHAPGDGRAKDKITIFASSGGVITKQEIFVTITDTD